MLFLSRQPPHVPLLQFLHVTGGVTGGVDGGCFVASHTINPVSPPIKTNAMIHPTIDDSPKNL